MVLGLLSASQPLLGQQITASITGTVEDSAGAALNDATVTARDTERGTSSTTKTTQGGVFNFNNLPIGTYEVKAEAAGFDTEVLPPITLVLNQRARLEFKMKVGAVTNTVQVSSEAPQLQADTTQVSTLIDANTIVGIPLATRNYVELTLLAPGSVTPDNSTFNNGDNTATVVAHPLTDIVSSPITSSWTGWITTRPQKTSWASRPPLTPSRNST